MKPRYCYICKHYGYEICPLSDFWAQVDYWVYDPDKTLIAEIYLARSMMACANYQYAEKRSQ